MEILWSNPYTVTIVGGIVVMTIGGIWKFVWKKEKSEPTPPQLPVQHQITQQVTIGKDFVAEPNSQTTPTPRTVNVLFIDDDARFKIVDILKKYPWIKCSIVKDIVNFDVPVLKEADIIFIDIEDVGTKLWPKDQGLGVVVEINRKYPSKHIVIYSSSTTRNMTHRAFTIAEGILPKDAQPSEFVRYIEEVRVG